MAVFVGTRFAPAQFAPAQCAPHNARPHNARNLLAQAPGPLGYAPSFVDCSATTSTHAWVRYGLCPVTVRECGVSEKLQIWFGCEDTRERGSRLGTRSPGFPLSANIETKGGGEPTEQPKINRTLTPSSNFHSSLLYSTTRQTSTSQQYKQQHPPVPTDSTHLQNVRRRMHVWQRLQLCRLRDALRLRKRD